MRIRDWSSYVCSSDLLCTTLASDARALSPTRFHNSVHNAAAGYWTIGTGCHAPSTAISSFDASFAQGLLEALVQLRTGAQAVLLVAYDAPSAGPLAAVTIGRASCRESVGQDGE